MSAADHIGTSRRSAAKKKTARRGMSFALSIDLLPEMSDIAEILNLRKLFSISSVVAYVRVKE